MAEKTIRTFAMEHERQRLIHQKKRFTCQIIDTNFTAIIVKHF